MIYRGDIGLVIIIGMISRVRECCAGLVWKMGTVVFRLFLAGILAGHALIAHVCSSMRFLNVICKMCARILYSVFGSMCSLRSEAVLLYVFLCDVSVTCKVYLDIPYW